MIIKYVIVFQIPIKRMYQFLNNDCDFKSHFYKKVKIEYVIVISKVQKEDVLTFVIILLINKIITLFPYSIIKKVKIKYVICSHQK